MTSPNDNAISVQPPKNIPASIGERERFIGRTPDTSDDELTDTFAPIAAYRDGGIFAGGFVGESAWEKHPGDEVVQIFEGLTTLTILHAALTADGSPDRDEFQLSAGDLIVVPAQRWHRFATAGVSLMSVTPGPTEHSRAADPRH